MELIIEEIVDEICYLASMGHLASDVYLDDLIGHLLDYNKQR